MAAAGLVPNVANRLYQPQPIGWAFAAISAVVVFAIWSAYRQPTKISPIRAILAVSMLAAVGVVGLMVNVNRARWNDPSSTVSEFRRHLPTGANLVSFTPIEHRFAYYFDAPITEFDWPRAIDDLPSDVDYFCFMRFPGDTAESRAAGRGRSWYTTPGTLPFAWEELKAASVDRRVDANAMVVVLGRVVRPLQAKVTDATRPQHSAAAVPATTQHR